TGYSAQEKDMIDAAAWLNAYHQAWLTHDAERVAQLFTDDALYQSHPFRPPLRGRAEIADYWRRSTPSQEELEIRWGTLIASGDHAAVEWWATMRDTDDGPLTLPGCLIVRFAANGLCETLREYWHVEVGSRVLPPPGWGV
ncbi:MAG TPA: nuclear transport factor 2 family protein, partial [Ktedonobacterales bacterium]